VDLSIKAETVAGLCPFQRRVFALAAGDNLEHGIWSADASSQARASIHRIPLADKAGEAKETAPARGKPEAVIEVLMYRGQSTR